MNANPDPHAKSPRWTPPESAPRIAAWIGLGLAGLLVAGALLAPHQARSQAPEASIPETVTVSGLGEVEGPPDIARVTLGIHARNASAGDAMAEVSETTRRVLAALRAVGIDEDQATTQHVSLDRSYNRRGRPDGYQASTALRVETPDFDKIGAVIDAAVGAGANRVGGITFDREDDGDAVQDALEAAIEDARTKAETLAEASGRTLGRALVIAEEGTNPPRPVFADAVSAGGIASAGGGSFSVPVNPGPQTTRVRITVTFALD